MSVRAIQIWLTKNDCTTSVPFPPLDTNQEEADARLIRHDVAATGIGSPEVIISSPEASLLYGKQTVDSLNVLRCEKAAKKIQPKSLHL